MLFWLICGMMILCALAVLALPMLRGRDGAGPDADVAIYQAQLAEVERDMARGILDDADAARARVEIARRLLAVKKDGVAPGDAPERATRGAIAALAVFLGGMSVWAYVAVGAPGAADQPLERRIALSDEMRENRPAQAAMEAAAPAPPAVDAPPAYLANVAELRDLMQTRADDVTGWELLAYHEAELRNYAAAARAQEKVVTLKGEAAGPEDWRLQLDLMVAAADGYVSPEAEILIRRLLAANENHVPARYYLGALYNQTGRPDLAFRLWRPLVEEAPDSFHTALARAQIDATAQMAGVRYRAPERRGPSLADIAAAEDLSPEDRAAMITGMVAQLSNRLATEGGGPAEWARLIRAYGVLGDTENARAIWTEARDVFGADANAMAGLEEAARAAGVLE